MKKIVLSVDFTGNRMKTKAMKAVSKLPGVESVSVDLDDKKLTVIGDVDPVWVVEKLRKKCDTEIISIGPAKEPEKKKKENPKKEEQKKNEAAASAPPLPPNWGDYWRYSEFYHSQTRHPYYYTSTVEEDPNSCVIC